MKNKHAEKEQGVGVGNYRTPNCPPGWEVKKLVMEVWVWEEDRHFHRGALHSPFYLILTDIVQL